MINLTKRVHVVNTENGLSKMPILNLANLSLAILLSKSDSMPGVLAQLNEAVISIHDQNFGVFSSGAVMTKSK